MPLSLLNIILHLLYYAYKCNIIHAVLTIKEEEPTPGRDSVVKLQHQPGNSFFQKFTCQKSRIEDCMHDDVKFTHEHNVA